MLMLLRIITYNLDNLFSDVARSLDHITNNKMNATKACETSYSGRSFLTETQINILLFIDIATGFGNLIANGLVILALVLSKQTATSSMKLIFLLSVSDCFLACFSQTLFAVMLTTDRQQQNSCQIEMAAQFFAILFTHTSVYIIVLIAFDRYAHLKFLTKYTTVVTPHRLQKSVWLVATLAVLQASAYVMGTHYGMFNTVKRVLIFIDILILCTAIVFTLLAVKAVREHRRQAQNQSILNEVNRTVSRLAAKILLTILGFYSVYIVIASVHAAKKQSTTGAIRGWLEFGLFFGYLLAYANSLANAIIFFDVNRKARHAVIQRFCRLSSISSSRDHGSDISVAVAAGEEGNGDKETGGTETTI